ncbi:MAG: Ni/Fe-hydrogenase cytochrome b subunit [Dehalogenimonas sp.]|uniref:Ni/Fe-hydrogenase cytochrome b subunit n=1 Tax=Candidatus Dehalogenimonas loeffleri TaxID=3127115 RepID=A0ABZ2J268_9CHLR|nr:Ni/Fe-hydrogenase cytochrome b subunit [Dehalogenimonas sp.]
MNNKPSLYTRWAPSSDTPLFTPWSVLLLLLAIGALAVAAGKFIFGMHAVDNLSNDWPWGIWVSFNVMAGVALSAGGFVTAGIVYIFRIKRYWPVIRPAVFTAFIGYVIAGAGIAIDIGRTPRIVHPLWMWQPESVMFEVAVCMTIYTTVLFFEFSPLIAERFRLRRTLKFLHAIMIPLIILGITLSFMHQSSLGAVHLIMPHLMYPLWYSEWMGHMFFVSAMALGLCVVIIESTISSKIFKKGLRIDLLGGLGKAAAWILLAYLLFRFWDLNTTGRLDSFTLDNTFGWLFTVEIGLMTLAMILLFIKGVRRSAGWLFTASMFVLIAVVLNRLTTDLIAMAPSRTTAYVPAWTELLFSIGLVAGAMFVFRVVAKYLPLFEGRGYGLSGEEEKASFSSTAETETA